MNALGIDMKEGDVIVTTDGRLVEVFGGFGMSDITNGRALFGYLLYYDAEHGDYKRILEGILEDDPESPDTNYRTVRLDAIDDVVALHFNVPKVRKEFVNLTEALKRLTALTKERSINPQGGTNTLYRTRNILDVLEANVLRLGGFLYDEMNDMDSEGGDK